MSPRNTTTGKVLEAMILPSLANGGYAYQTQVNVGQRPGGGKHMIDVMATKDGQTILVSLKWQQVGGTAEQKVPFEVISLTQAVLDSNGKFGKAYLVLGGSGWTLREFYTGGGLTRYLEYADKVEIRSLENFVALVNQGRL
jgi:hypothetical protein